MADAIAAWWTTFTLQAILLSLPLPLAPATTEMDGTKEILILGLQWAELCSPDGEIKKKGAMGYIASG